ncbi:hypothetical protein SFRURICE_005411 [Spodoptera frugiperda]|nr:hypothetical protein SFRURICE_005411 [Spodoptera frugiperda]
MNRSCVTIDIELSILHPSVGLIDSSGYNIETVEGTTYNELLDVGKNGSMLCCIYYEVTNLYGTRYITRVIANKTLLLYNKTEFNNHKTTDNDTSYGTLEQNIISNALKLINYLYLLIPVAVLLSILITTYIYIRRKRLKAEIAPESINENQEINYVTLDLKSSGMKAPRPDEPHVINGQTSKQTNFTYRHALNPRRGRQRCTLWHVMPLCTPTFHNLCYKSHVIGEHILSSPVSFKYLENDFLNLNIVLENVPSDITKYLLHIRTDRHGLNISHITPKNGTHNIKNKLNVKNVVLDLEIKNNGQTCAIFKILNGTQSTGLDGRSEFREQCLNHYDKNYCSIKVDFKNRCEDDSRLECDMKDETLTCFSGNIGHSEVAWSQHYIGPNDESSVSLPSTKVKGNSYMKMKMYKFDNNTQLSMETEFSKKYYNVSVPVEKAAESRISALYYNCSKIYTYDRKSLNWTKPIDLVNILFCCVQYKISKYGADVIKNALFGLTTVQFNNVPVKRKESVCYLGLVLEKNVSFIEHIKAISEKAKNNFYALTRISKATWGLYFLTLRTIYGATYLGCVCYGAPVWADRATVGAVRRKLLQSQRLALIFLCKAYRTASTEALPALSGLLPVDLEVQRRAAMYYNARPNFSANFLAQRD